MIYGQDAGSLINMYPEEFLFVTRAFIEGIDKHGS